MLVHVYMWNDFTTPSQIFKGLPIHSAKQAEHNLVQNLSLSLALPL